MKKVLIVLLVVMMTLAGCGRKNNNNNNNNNNGNNNTPTVEPKDNTEKNERQFVSKLGTNDDIDDALDDFNEDFRDWNAFMMYENSDGSYEYGFWDDDEIYRRNFESYAKDGIMPIVYVVTRYQDGKGEVPIKDFAAWLPFENVEELPEGYEEQMEEIYEELLEALFPDLSDEKIDKLIEKLCLTDADGFAAYRNHQASVSDFEKTTVEVYPSNDSDKPYKVTVEYDADHSTLLLSYLSE